MKIIRSASGGDGAVDHTGPSAPEAVDASDDEVAADDRRRTDTAEPVPLTPDRRLPRFPTESLPSPVRAMVEAVAEATQTDAGMAGTVALGALAACAGGRVMIENRPGWREPLNLFTVTVAGPGERKSAVLAAITAPLQAAEKTLVEEGHAARVEALTTRDVALKAAEGATAAAGKANLEQRDELLAAAIDAREAATSVEIPPVARLLADDVTPEALATLLAEQDGRLAVISAEGGIFDTIAGRYSGNVPALDVWLKGHSGDPVRVDRKGREPEYIEHPALTLSLMIQPSVLTALARQPSFRGRGLLARFLFCLPTSRVGRRKINPRPVPADAAQAYANLLGELAVGLAGWRDPAVITLDPEASARLVNLERSVEPDLGEGGELQHIADWGSKYVGATMRIAGLLHLAEHPNDGFRRPVSVQMVEAAIKLGEYYRQHALVAFEEMRTDPTVHAAEYLLTVIRRVGHATVSRRELHTASSRSRFPKTDDLDPALRLLEEHGYLTRIQPLAKTVGRPPSPRWAVHPSLTPRAPASTNPSARGEEPAT